MIKHIFTATLLLNILFFCSLITLICIIVYSVKLKYFDRSNKIITLSLLLTMVCQIIGLTLYKIDRTSELWTNIMNSINLICDMIKWIILFMFIFDMLQVSVTLESQSELEVQSKLLKVKKQRWYSIGISTSTSLIYRIVIMIMLTNNDFYIQNQTTLSIIGITSRVLYLLAFTYIAVIWIGLINQFIIIKRENMKKNLIKLSCFNKFIISSVLTVTALTILHTLWMGISGIYELLVREQMIKDN